MVSHKFSFANLIINIVCGDIFVSLFLISLGSRELHRYIWSYTYGEFIKKETHDKIQSTLYLFLAIASENSMLCLWTSSGSLKAVISRATFPLGGNTFGNNVLVSSKVIYEIHQMICVFNNHSIFQWSQYFLRPVGKYICYYRNNFTFSSSYPCPYLVLAIYTKNRMMAWTVCNIIMRCTRIWQFGEGESSLCIGVGTGMCDISLLWKLLVSHKRCILRSNRSHIFAIEV